MARCEDPHPSTRYLRHLQENYRGCNWEMCEWGPGLGPGHWLLVTTRPGVTDQNHGKYSTEHNTPVSNTNHWLFPDCNIWQCYSLLSVGMRLSASVSGDQWWRFKWLVWQSELRVSAGGRGHYTSQLQGTPRVTGTISLKSSARISTKHFLQLSQPPLLYEQ